MASAWCSMFRYHHPFRAMFHFPDDFTWSTETRKNTQRNRYCSSVCLAPLFTRASTGCAPTSFESVGQGLISQTSAEHCKTQNSWMRCFNLYNLKQLNQSCSVFLRHEHHERAKGLFQFFMLQSLTSVYIWLTGITLYSVEVFRSILGKQLASRLDRQAALSCKLCPARHMSS